jgi:ferredoxin-like protein FixX
MKTRKDPNTIAAIEKAIAEKYGKNTVQDFRNEWKEDKEKDYLNQLKETRIKRDKFSISKEEIIVGDVKIKKRRDHKKCDRTCPVCKTYSFSRKDDLYMNRFKSCYDCYIDFIMGREEEWHNGKRPTDEHIEYALRRRK